MTFGENLVNLRKGKGVSQEQLAEVLGLARQTISKWELNQSTPDLQNIIKLGEFFQVSTDYLLKGEAAESGDTYKKEEAVQVENEDVKRNPIDESGYRWCFYLGMVLSAVSLLGMIVFVVCSIFKPWEVWADGLYYTGITGFLMGTRTQGFFAALNVFFLSGLGLAGFGIVKRLYPSFKIWESIKNWIKGDIF